MAKRTEERELPANKAAEIERVAALLGSYRVVRRRLFHQLDVHEFLDRGLPRAAVTHLYNNITLLHSRKFFEHALGISERTFQRSKLTPAETAEVRADLEICGNRSESDPSIRIPGRGIGLA